MWQAIRDQKWSEVEHHLAPTFVGLASNGQKFDRTTWVEYWKEHQPGDVSLGELSVQPDGPDMVVTYELHLSGASSPGVQVVSVWQQLKRGWVLIAQTMTPIRSN